MVLDPSNSSSWEQLALKGLNEWPMSDWEANGISSVPTLLIKYGTTVLYKQRDKLNR